MKVLHVASFSGNIGDNANHAGFRRWFERLVAPRPVAWEEWEIREHYWKLKKFDGSFVEHANKFDLLVFGGGNYFELWVDSSPTGTSIDIPLEDVRRLTVPVFFNALGCDIAQGASPLAVERFNAFVELLVHSPRCLVSVRNDGATAAIAKVLRPELAAHVFTVPDGGFFADYPPIEGASVGPIRVGINLACDMPAIRFRGFGEEKGYDRFCTEFAAVVEALARDRANLEVEFFPHIYSDLKIISDVIARLDDRLRRRHVRVAPYLSGAAGAGLLFGAYRNCDLVLGMRFHANVCAMGMSIPVLGLCNYPQIRHLYAEVGAAERCIDVSAPGFATQLIEAAKLALSDDDGESRDALVRRVTEQRRAFEPAMSAWLRKNGLIENHV